MAITYPLSVASFWSLLKLAPGSVLRLPDNRALLRTTGGDALSASRGTRYWRGVAVLAPEPQAGAFDRQAQIADLLSAGGTFLAHDPSRPAPASDLDGTILGASTPVVSGLPAALSQIRFSGLPAGYILKRGDMVSVLHATNRRALFVITEGGVVDGTGTTPVLSVRPNRPSTVAVSDPVFLAPAVAEFMVEPDTFNEGQSDGVNLDGASFGLVQVRP